MPITGQTTVTTRIKALYPGVFFNNRPTDIVTAISDETDDGLKWGDFAYLSSFSSSASGLDAPKVKKVTGALGDLPDKILGIVVHEDLPQGQIKKGKSIGLLRKGVVWVDETSGAITAAAQVFWDVSAGKFITTGDVAGDWILNGFKFFKSAAAGVLVPLEVNLPNYIVAKA